MPIEFIIFGAMLVGIAVFHRRALLFALCGFGALALYSSTAGELQLAGLAGLSSHFAHEWPVLANLLALLLGFALLADHFERTGIPSQLPRILPNGWMGGVVLLAMVFVLSAFLDNIAAAIIGGSIARAVYHRLHIGFLAAIVAASNAGGAGSVLGDTTTTMMWIEGVPATQVLSAYIASGVALVCFAIPAALQQQRLAPMLSDPVGSQPIDWARAGVVLWALVAAVATNLTVNLHWPDRAGSFPFLGLAVWLALLLAAVVRPPSWKQLPKAARGAVFLLSLVASASLMPVEELPPASWSTALGIGFVSALFDNIPLTKLALDQGGYDWDFLAYAVGFGGSMIWFGSSAGVAISTEFPQARSACAWLRSSWYLPLAYLAGFFALLGILGWHPQPPAQ